MRTMTAFVGESFFELVSFQMFISGGGESDLYAVMARTGGKGISRLKHFLN